MLSNNQHTILLRKAAQGDQLAGEEIYTLFYKEIHKLAQARMRQESSGHTLRPTALVNEAWLKLINVSQIEWQDRRHFLAMASQIMRQILVDHARAKHADKRGGGEFAIEFDESIHNNDSNEDLVEIDQALKALQAIDPRKVQLVELKFFGGFENEEIAEMMGVSLATVKRDWAFARAWLHQYLRGEIQ